MTPAQRASASLLLMASCAPPSAPYAILPLPLQPLAQPERTTIIAHRGGAGMGPESTLTAMRRSLDAGATVLELDVHLSRDAIPVIIHDATVDRTTNGTGPVADLDYDLLRTLDAGGGETIPHLADALRAFPDTPFILELKGDHPDLVAVTTDVLRDEDALSRVILASFWTDRLEAARAIPEAPATGLSTGEVLDWLWFENDPDYRPPGAFAQIPPQVGGHSLITAERIARARQLGLTLQVWTVNDPTRARALAAAGVSGILTDRPDVVSTALASAGPSAEP